MRTARPLSAALALAVLLALGSVHGAPTALRATTPTRPASAALPHPALVGFEPNVGQADPAVRFLARGPGSSLLLTDGGVVHSVLDAGGEASVIRSRFLQAASHPDIVAASPRVTRANSFIGSDPSRWYRDVPVYGAVRYRGLYPGVDLLYHVEETGLEYDVVVGPGRDPGAFALFFGPWRPALDLDGNLVLTLGGRSVTWRAPLAYQEDEERRIPVGSSYRIGPGGAVGFSVGAHDPRLSLVIDPTFVFSTYMGGSKGDEGDGVVVDAVGAAYQTGTTFSPDLPATLGAYDETFNGAHDGFAAKYNPATNQIVYVTYLGGTSTDRGRDVGVDPTGNLFVVGATRSSDFPTTAGTFQPDFGGTQDAFMVKLGPAGDQLLWSTFLGGSRADGKPNMVTDSSGNAYITGFTFSSNFPTKNPYQANWKAGADTYVANLNGSNGTAVFSTYLGGNGSEAGRGIAVDSTGVYLTGFTESSNFPTPNGFDTSLGGTRDAYVAKLSTDGKSLLFSSYLGGSNVDAPYQGSSIDLATDLVTGLTTAIWLVGYTYSKNFPATAGAYQTTFGGSKDAYVAEVSSNGASLLYATYLGGEDKDEGTSIALDGSGNVYAVGWTKSSPFATGTQRKRKGKQDAFVAKFSSAGALLASTYLGGSGIDSARGVETFGSNVYVSGISDSDNFPLSANAPQATRAGAGDVFLCVLTL